MNNAYNYGQNLGYGIKSVFTLNFIKTLCWATITSLFLAFVTGFKSDLWNQNGFIIRICAVMLFVISIFELTQSNKIAENIDKTSKVANKTCGLIALCIFALAPIMVPGLLQHGNGGIDVYFTLKAAIWQTATVNYISKFTLRGPTKDANGNPNLRGKFNKKIANLRGEDKSLKLFWLVIKFVVSFLAGFIAIYVGYYIDPLFKVTITDSMKSGIYGATMHFALPLANAAIGSFMFNNTFKELDRDFDVTVAAKSNDLSSVSPLLKSGRKFCGLMFPACRIIKYSLGGLIVCAVLALADFITLL